MDNTLRKAAEMALEAFQSCRWDCDENNEPHKTFNDILVSRASEALRQELAQQALADSIRPRGKSITKVWVDEINQALAQGEPWDTSDMAHRTGGLSAEECIDRGAWSDVPDATKWVDELRGDEDSEQEPVAHLWECLGRWSAYLATNGTQADCAPPDYLVEAVKAATAPPSKPWVSLTDEERHSIREWQRIQEELGAVWSPMMLYLYEAIEAKLKEKNNG